MTPPIQARGLIPAWQTGHELSTRLASSSAILLIAGAVFVPGHLSDWLVERIFVALLFAIAAFFVVEANLLSRGVFGLLAPGAVLGWILAIQIVYLIGTLVSQFVGPLPFNPMELVRYPAIAGIVLFLGTLSGPHVTRAVGRIGRWSLVYTATVVAAMNFRPPIIGSVVEALYQDTKTTIVLPAKLRISVPFENPNYLAFYLIGVVIYLLYLDRTRFRYLYLLLASVLVLFTGSKAGWIAFSLVITLWLGKQLWTFVPMRGGRQAAAALSLLILPVMVLLGRGLFEQVVGDTDRVESTIAYYQTGQLLTDPSAAAHIQLARTSVQTFSESPFVGWGSADHVDLPVFDNQYTLWLVRLGLIGTTLVLLFYGQIVLTVFRGIRGEIRFGFTSYIIAVLVMLATGVFLENFRLLVVFLALLSAFAGATVRSQEVRANS